MEGNGINGANVHTVFHCIQKIVWIQTHVRKITFYKLKLSKQDLAQNLKTVNVLYLLQYNFLINGIPLFASSRSEVFCKKGVIRNFTKFTEKYLWQSFFFNKVAGLRSATLKETLAQVFSCEYCEISKNIFFHRTPLMVVSVFL